MESDPNIYIVLIIVIFGPIVMSFYFIALVIIKYSPIIFSFYLLDYLRKKKIYFENAPNVLRYEFLLSPICKFSEFLNNYYKPSRKEKENKSEHHL